MSHSKIKIKDNILEYENISVTYSNKLVKNNGLRSFCLELLLKDINKIDMFDSLLRDIRSIVLNIKSDSIQPLWDDISYYYCTKSYPLLNKIENLMRKLLTSFMLLNVGTTWDKKNTPKELRESMYNKKNTDSHGLHNLLITQANKNAS